MTASDKLAALGAEATPGPWRRDGHYLVDPDDEYLTDFVAHYDADLVLALCNALPEIEALVRAAEEKHGPWIVRGEVQSLVNRPAPLCKCGKVLADCPDAQALDALDKRLTS